MRASCRNEWCALGTCLAHAVFEARLTRARGPPAGGGGDVAASNVVHGGGAWRAGRRSGRCADGTVPCPCFTRAFPIFVRPAAASQLQLGQPWQATSKMHDVVWLAGNSAGAHCKGRQLARSSELSTLASRREERRPALPFRALHAVPLCLCDVVQCAFCCHGWRDAPDAAAFCGNGGMTAMPSDGLSPRAAYQRRDEFHVDWKIGSVTV